MNHGDALATVLYGVNQRFPDQPFRAKLADGLYTYPRVGPETCAHFLLQEPLYPGRLGRTGLVLHAGIDILRVLPEDHDVNILRVFQRARHAWVPSNRTDAGVKVKILAQRQH